jgi:hypothetical protein
MAEIAKSGTPSLATVQPGYEHQLNGLIAGETLAEGDFVYINADGKVYRASGAAANAAARARGMVLQGAAAGDGVAVLSGVSVRYGANLTPGAQYFLSGTNPGGLADAASTGGTAAIAYAIDTTRIKVVNL